ncbi:hypothetical protein C0991_002750 [Blastosporella zonata]|nr:hypothetical protein C0991_002750 [Blastosporella zonata]
MQTQDSGGIWDIMENAQPIGLVTSALPWLADFFNQIPGTAETMKQFREFSRQRVLKRLKAGSATRDLFYHLALRLIPALLSGSMRSPLVGSGGFMLGPQ